MSRSAPFLALAGVLFLLAHAGPAGAEVLRRGLPPPALPLPPPGAPPRPLPPGPLPAPYYYRGGSQPASPPADAAPADAPQPAGASVRAVLPRPVTLVAGGAEKDATLVGESLDQVAEIVPLRDGKPASAVTAVLGPADGQGERKVTFRALASCPPGSYTLRARTPAGDLLLAPSGGYLVVEEAPPKAP